jgi:enoyl-CoA hydratase
MHIPVRRNAVCPQTARELESAFAQFELDEKAQVAVLAGSEGNFCSGYDLKETAKLGKISFPSVGSGPGPMGPSRMRFSKPTIAAISGYAVAGERALTSSVVQCCLPCILTGHLLDWDRGS